MQLVLIRNLYLCLLFLLKILIQLGFEPQSGFLNRVK